MVRADFTRRQNKPLLTSSKFLLNKICEVDQVGKSLRPTESSIVKWKIKDQFVHCFEVLFELFMLIEMSSQ